MPLSDQERRHAEMVIFEKRRRDGCTFRTFHAERPSISRSRARKIGNPIKSNYWRRMASGWTSERRAGAGNQALAAVGTRNRPRTVNGKARSAQNAYAGGQWRRCRDMAKTLNVAMRVQRNLVRDPRGI